MIFFTILVFLLPYTYVKASESDFFQKIAEEGVTFANEKLAEAAQQAGLNDEEFPFVRNVGSLCIGHGECDDGEPIVDYRGNVVYIENNTFLMPNHAVEIYGNAHAKWHTQGYLLFTIQFPSQIFMGLSNIRCLPIEINGKTVDYVYAKLSFNRILLKDQRPFCEIRLQKELFTHLTTAYVACFGNVYVAGKDSPQKISEQITTVTPIMLPDSCHLLVKGWNPPDIQKQIMRFFIKAQTLTPEAKKRQLIEILNLTQEHGKFDLTQNNMTSAVWSKGLYGAPIFVKQKGIYYLSGIISQAFPSGFIDDKSLSLCAEDSVFFDHTIIPIIDSPNIQTIIHLKESTKEKSSGFCC